MSDLPRPERTRAAEEIGETGREARLEELLLAGLDEYFAGHYQEAINVWTRVAFLERGHSRARAYIARARSALAERQRESEEQLHQGIAAYHAGETELARALLTRAIEKGGPSDRALVFLDRLNRASAPLRFQAPVASVVLRPQPNMSGESQSAEGHWVRTLVASIALAAGVLVAMLAAVAWLTDPRNTPTVSRDRGSMERLPVVTRAEAEIERARLLHAAGRAREALLVLGSVDRLDPAREDADRLRAVVQQELLAPGSRGSAATAAEPHP